MTSAKETFARVFYSFEIERKVVELRVAPIESRPTLLPHPGTLVPWHLAPCLSATRICESLARVHCTCTRSLNAARESKMIFHAPPAGAASSSAVQ